MAGQMRTRCCVEFCDGAGATPVQLLTNLHVMLCNLHTREWRAQHSSAHVRTPEAHQRWRAWVKEASHRAWLLQTQDRQQLEASLKEERLRLRRGELDRFRQEVSKNETPARPRRTPLALRALRGVGNRLRGPTAAKARAPTSLAIRRKTGEQG